MGWRIRIVLSVCIACAGCAPKGIVHPGGEDNYGCKEPPPDTFTSAGVDARFAESMFGKVVTGSVDFKTHPSVVTLASQAVRDARISNFLQCLALKRDGFTPAQVIYQQKTTAFLSTNPTAEEFMKWQQHEPFPVGSDEQVKVLEREVDKLREQVTKSDQDLRTLQEQVKERKLTTSQRARVIEALSKGEKGEIDVAYVSGNSESEHFAYDIALALQDSGWKVAHMSSVVSIGSTPVGLLAVVRDLQMPSVQALLSALLQIDRNIKLKINPKLPVPISLHVGNKP